MHIVVPHKATRVVAIAKIKEALKQGKSQMGDMAKIDKEEWQEEVLHFAVTLQGKQITGTLNVTDTDMVIDAKLPLLWRIFEGKIERMIAEQVKSL
jgi:Putative polyhydroxyalkanoic acid system protein (PHA_gran_rgn)